MSRLRAGARRSRGRVPPRRGHRDLGAGRGDDAGSSSATCRALPRRSGPERRRRCRSATARTSIPAGSCSSIRPTMSSISTGPPSEFPTNVASTLDDRRGAAGGRRRRRHGRGSPRPPASTPARRSSSTAAPPRSRRSSSRSTPAARTVTFTAGWRSAPATSSTSPPTRRQRRAYLRTCEIDVLVYENDVLTEAFEGLTWNPDPATDAGPALLRRHG